ncbi:MAG: DMT family transporter [Rhodobacteraceae bacterium]|jgi:drug/metabolite transporter (DMT)-like permease|nr:DMT family transporter [Paracoccaceae bacterium]
MPTQYHPGKAALWMLGAMTGMISMAMAGRAVADSHDTFEIMAWRSLVGMILVLGGAAATGRLSEIRARRLKLHALRNVFHFAGQNLWFAALSMIPLAQLFALEFSTPILVALASPFVLHEALTRRRLGAAALGFAGVLIVADPWGSGGIGLGTIFAMLCAFGFAGSILFTKVLTRTAPVTEILFWLTVFQFGFGLVLALADGQTAWPTARSFPWLVLIGVAGIGAHLCLTRALSLAPASVVAPIDFARLPMIAIVGALFYNEPLAAPIFVGGAIILLANWINIRRGRAASPSATMP